jgi:O-antigen/teichoic acid export membrane protein
MRTLYLISMVGTRLIGVLTILVLSYVMSPTDFGTYVLISTNALMTQAVATSWIVSIAGRVLVSEGGAIDQKAMASIVSALLLMFMIIVIAAVAYAFQEPEQRWQVLATVGLAGTISLYDVTLAAKNAAGREAAYARFSLYRNIVALMLSLALVELGYGWPGAVSGLIIGTAAPLLILPSARSVWTGAWPSEEAARMIGRHLSLGVAGGIVLGIYILVNAPVRNIIAQHFGKAEAGVWNLCGDLFYGPLVLIGNAYALSQVRLIYLALEGEDDEVVASRSRDFVEFTLAIAIPYALGGYLFGADAARLLLSDAHADLAAAIAAPAAVQGAVLLLLYTLSAIAFARRRFGLIVMMVATTALSATVAALLGGNLIEAIYSSTVASMAVAVFWLGWAVATRLARLRWLELGKLVAAVAAMWVVARLALTMLDIPGGWAVAALAAAAAFIGASATLRLRGFAEALPPVLRLRVMKSAA